ncbi:lysophospholipase L1-like esterase [Microbacterium sp. SORGH_AS428]|uniref:SGNH/GDSL hydrolase family protein n=1 Tax=Microbacterium sp. SORGH_AS_0428 TaxID=3041788 RepID=UPI00285C630F|nr:SGNH/GDSL hydrolase family protein [Microbacterium sp. SORGH_AS_0428]MDR6198987.1 lysophospholipase L1-like esterase [Microbacterium sp. SORGH_AS_0428]
MTRSARLSPRRAIAVLAALAAAIACICALALTRPWAAGALPVSRADAGGAAPAPVVSIALPDNPRILVLGDSWTYGSAASAPTLGYAYLLGPLMGGETSVNGSRGSGYLVPGIDGGTFSERIAELDASDRPDLIVVQGSINDRKVPLEGYDEAVREAWDSLAALYPDAQIVVLGPAPQILPVEAATSEIDDRLGRAAASRGWPYISPIGEQWITPDNYAWIIDSGPIGRHHPTTGGHAYLAERLAAALDGLRSD